MSIKIPSGKKYKKFKLCIKYGEASAAPPLGPALGQRGVSIPEFVKKFNEATNGLEKGAPATVTVIAFEDRTFLFEFSAPLTSYLIKKACNITTGAHTPGREVAVAKISAEKVAEIARIKLKDLNCFTEEVAQRMVLASAKSMGVELEDEV